MSYNIDLNDEKVWKRNSLLNLLYKKTYNKDINIKPAPSWKVLKDFGGTVTIDEFRDNLDSNTYDFTYLHPPLIAFSSSINKSYKKEKYKHNKNSSDDIILKRSKPLKTTRYSLENTMGLKIKKKKKI